MVKKGISLPPISSSFVFFFLSSGPLENYRFSFGLHFNMSSSLPPPKGFLLSHLLIDSLFKREGDVPGGLTAEQVDHHLVGEHHDGRVGDLSDEVGG